MDMNGGGLPSPEMMNFYVDEKDRMGCYNKRPEETSDDFFVRIGNGLWMDLSYYLRSGGQKEYRPARPFIAPAQVEAAMIVKTALHGL